MIMTIGEGEEKEKRRNRRKVMAVEVVGKGKQVEENERRRDGIGERRTKTNRSLKRDGSIYMHFGAECWLGFGWARA